MGYLPTYSTCCRIGPYGISGIAEGASVPQITINFDEEAKSLGTSILMETAALSNI
jgi:hypothetical protein